MSLAEVLKLVIEGGSLIAVAFMFLKHMDRQSERVVGTINKVCDEFRESNTAIIDRIETKIKSVRVDCPMAPRDKEE